MMKLEFPVTITIDAPAAKVWHVIAHRFADIGTWASTIPNSTVLAHLPILESAPVGGRACSATVAGFSTVHEQFTEFDESKMRFRYQAIAGLPFMIHQAANQWSVHPLTADRSRVEVCAEIELNTLDA